MRFFALDNLKSFQSGLEFECAQALPQALFKVVEGFTDAAAQDDDVGIVSVKDSLDDVGQMVTETGKGFGSSGVTGVGALLEFKGVGAEFALKITSTAVVFELAFFVRSMANFPRATVAPGIQLAINNDAGAEAGAENETDNVFVAASKAIMKFTERETFGVVINKCGNFKALLEKFFEWDLAPGRNIGDGINYAVFDEAGCADTDATDAGFHDSGDGFENFFEDNILRGLGGDGLLMQGNDFAVMNKPGADVGAAEVNADEHGMF